MANGIKIGDLNISYFKVGGSDCSIYLGNTLVYPTSPSQTPCFAVVDDISDYTDTDFVDVYAKLTDKWYKLNNLNEYEEYGVYGEGRNITYYEGKLTIDGDYEYQYSGGSWVNIGEISGSTARLPDVPFTVNYNAKNYDSTTKTFAKTSGQLADRDVTISKGTPTPHDTYVTVASETRGVISGYATYFNRTDSAPELTIISKQRTDGSYCHLFANRGSSNYNWMYRAYSNKLTLHGTSEQGSIAVTTQPVIEGVRVDSNRLATYNNYTNNTTSTQSNFSYGATNGDVALFAGYAVTGKTEWFVGDFYWIYMSQTKLTDAQVQQVIDYNEGGGGQSEYPEYYEDKQDPPTQVTFATMEEALAYACPYVGMSAYIDGVRYVFSGDSQSGYEWIISPIDYSTEYLSIIASTDNVTVTLYGGVSSNVFQYSLDNGSTWSNLQIGQTSPSINEGEKIMFKASGLSVGGETGIGTIRPSAAAIVEGNIMSLLYGDNFGGQTVIPSNFNLRKLFSGATNITSAENLVIPATTVKKQCYSQMFQGCTNLVTAPKVIGSSAMTWSGDYCWSDMFHGCSSLVNAPQLPATTLGTQCYWFMFEGCTALETAPVLPALTLNNQCYTGMFNGCSSLNYIKAMFTTAPSSSYMNSWVNGVSASGTFVKNSAATWTTGCGIATYPCNWTVITESE